MNLTLTPQLRLGKLFKKGKIEDIGNGSIEIQLAIVATSDSPMVFAKDNWDWNYNTNVFIGSSDTINIPMNSDTAKFIPPYDAFKLKVTMHTGGEVNIKFKYDKKWYVLTLTTEMLLANISNPEALAKTWNLEVSEEPIPDIEPIPIPDEDIPVPDVKPIVTGFWDTLKQVVINFLKKSKWYFVIYLLGLLTPTITKILSWVFKIF